jgi:uncharacterized membrane protein YeaQ/YmgE (transglycosylase-associated protein family)
VTGGRRRHGHRRLDRRRAGGRGAGAAAAARPDPVGCLGTILIGIGGSFVGGLLASLIFEGDLQLRPAGLIGSVIGAMLLLLLRRALVGNRYYS